MCWQLNNKKWIPLPLNDTFQKVEAALSVLNLDDWPQATPKRILAKGETMYFISNAEDFWLTAAPFTVVTFLILMFLYNKLRRYWISGLLLGFSTTSYLASSLVGDNVQYLTFRSFQQLRCMAPRSPLEYLSIFLAVLCLFVVVVAVGCLYLMIWSWDRKRFATEYYKQRISSYFMLHTAIAGAGLNGFTHAYFDNVRVQLPCLLLVCLATLLISCRFSFLFKNKYTFCIYALRLTFRLLLNATLLVEVWTDELESSTIVEASFSEVTLCVVYGLFLSVLLEELLRYIRPAIEFLYKKILFKRCKRNR